MTCFQTTNNLALRRRKTLNYNGISRQMKVSLSHCCLSRTQTIRTNSGLSMGIDGGQTQRSWWKYRRKTSTSNSLPRLRTALCQTRNGCEYGYTYIGSGGNGTPKRKRWSPIAWLTWWAAPVVLIFWASPLENWT